MGIKITDTQHELTSSTEVGTTVNEGGTLSLNQNAAVFNTIVNSGGSLVLQPHEDNDTDAFAFSFNAIINSAGHEFISAGGIDVSATLRGTGEQNISSGGVAIATTAIAGGEQEVLKGGLASATIVGIAGEQSVELGGTAIGTVVQLGGTQFVGNNEIAGKFPETAVETFSGGTAIGTTVNGGGFQMVALGGTIVGTTLTGVSPTIIAQNEVEDGATAISTTVNHNALQFVEDDGLSTFTTVNSGGFQVVAGFSVTSRSTVNAGGVQLLGFETATDEEGDGPGASIDTLLNGGTEVVEGPATTGDPFEFSTSLRTTVNAGGVQFVFGSATQTTVNSGTMVDWTLAFATKTTVSGKGSFDFVVGSATGDIVNNGAGEFVVSSVFASTPGTTFGTTVNSGGVEAVFGGVANKAVINPGATMLVSGGAGIGTGTDVGGLIRGVEFVQNGGQTVGTNVLAGGFQLVQAGGVARDALAGGVVEVQAGGTAFVNFITDSGGRLQLDASKSFVGNISGFASPAGIVEQIALADIGFVAGKTTETFTQTGASGTLTVTNGTATANLVLAGTYSTGNFQVSLDTQTGGTLVTDPPALVGSASSPMLAPHA
jgi:autotransporter passenger strand-loop-strand repeat protein